ncbi:MAG: 50S ribosomal protein L2 [Deltaproteobacteria bacterium]|nr:50S ribosomal protein L2 [Deltaproteobacteria bacterium]
MALQTYKPTSPGRRQHTGLRRDELTNAPLVKGLLDTWQRRGGRNNTGRVTMRHRGGGAKRRYRIVDFHRGKIGIAGTVAAIAYDPNRSANLALIHYVDGEKRYILHPVGLAVGDTIMASPEADIRPGNALPLRKIPVGTDLHNVALKIGGKAQLCRTAGAHAQLIAKDGDYAQIRLPSSEVRKIHLDCWGVVGQVGNVDRENISYGKAGRRRHLGRRPHVRGMCMNPVDHPHGGGEGRSKGGNHPVSPTGVPTKGYKTRKKKKPSNALIIKRRREK